MAENGSWRRAAVNVALIVAAGITYYFAQTSINAHAAKLPILSYFDCLNKVATFDWSKVGVTTHPSGGEICGELGARTVAH